MLNLTDRIHALLQGVKIGDRWGLPVEMLTRAQILARTAGRGVTKLEDVSLWRTDIQAAFAATSDDWQLTTAVGWCLASHPYATPKDMAIALVLAMRQSIVGWGGTTLNAVHELDEWLLTNGHAGRAPHHPPKRPTEVGKGTGCGVAMRIGALAAACALREATDVEVISACIAHGKLTHPDPRAWIGAAALALQLVWLLRGQKPASDESWLLRLTEALEPTEHACLEAYGGLPESEPRICQVLRYISLERLVDDHDRLLAEIGNNCPTFESVPYAIAMFLRHRTNFRAGILETITDGGDADSVASMVGALIGAHVGLEAIPLDWIRPEDGDVTELAHALVAAMR